jgi:hypothetical protein
MTVADAERDVFRRHATSVNVPLRLSSLAAWTRWLPGPNSSPGHSSRSPSPRRWAYVQGVAARARSLVPVLGAGEALGQTGEVRLPSSLVDHVPAPGPNFHRQATTSF